MTVGDGAGDRGGRRVGAGVRRVIDKAAIALNTINLLAVVGGRELTTPFVVTKVDVKQDEKWIPACRSFTRANK